MVVLVADGVAGDPADATPPVSTRLYEFDAASGTWDQLALPAPFDRLDALAAADGSSIALVAAQQVLVIDAGRRTHVLRPDNDPTVRTTWGSDGLAPVPGGGYVVVGEEREYVIRPASWTLDDVRIPPRYVVVGPTNDPSILVLAPNADRVQPQGLDGPHRLTLWAPKVPVLARLTTHPRTLRIDRSTRGLVYARQLKGWVLLSDVTERGVTEMPILFADIGPSDPDFESVSPSGRVAAVSCTTGKWRLADLRGSCPLSIAAPGGTGLSERQSAMLSSAWLGPGTIASRSSSPSPRDASSS